MASLDCLILCAGRGERLRPLTDVCPKPLIPVRGLTMADRALAACDALSPVRRFARGLKVPHMGWNEIVPRAGTSLLHNLGPKPYLYFAHSYYGPVCPATAATCDYGHPYTAVVETGNLFGVQFHPEKSGALGLRIVKNFVDL